MPLRWHARLLERRPVAGSLLSAGGAAAAGDALCQALEQVMGWRGERELGTRESAVVRMGGMAAFGLLVVGCGGHVWYRALAHKFPGNTYESAVRLTLDQALFAPVVLLGAVGFLPLLEGRGLDSARAHIDADWLHMLGKMWTFWAVTGISSYILLPLKYQPAAALASAVLWNTFVSYRLHRLAPLEMDEPEAISVEDYLRDHRSEVYRVSNASSTTALSARSIVSDGPSGSQLDRGEKLASSIGGRPKSL